MPRGENFKGKKPANSGRQKGTPNKANRTIKELAAKHDEDAINTLVEIMADGTQPGATRVSAAVHLLDRAHGKPVQAVEMDISTSEETAEERALRELAFERAIGNAAMGKERMLARVQSLTSTKPHTNDHRTQGPGTPHEVCP